VQSGFPRLWRTTARNAHLPKGKTLKRRSLSCRRSGRTTGNSCWPAMTQKENGSPTMKLCRRSHKHLLVPKDSKEDVNDQAHRVFRLWLFRNNPTDQKPQSSTLLQSHLKCSYYSMLIKNMHWVLVVFVPWTASISFDIYPPQPKFFVRIKKSWGRLLAQLDSLLQNLVFVDMRAFQTGIAVYMH